MDGCGQLPFFVVSGSTNNRGDGKGGNDGEMNGSKSKGVYSGTNPKGDGEEEEKEQQKKIPPIMTGDEW